MIYTADYIYYNGELYHAQKKQHKYVARVKTKNGKYRYFYTMDEYKAYKSGESSGKKEKTSKLKAVSNFFKNLKNSVNKILKKTKKELGKSLEKGKKFIDEVIFGKKKTKGNSILIGKEKKVKYVNRIKMSNGKYKYFYDAESYERYMKRINYQKNEPEFMKKVPKISEDKSYTADEDMAEVNKEYSKYDKATSRNCTNCTAAYELRCRGYDVSAAEYKNIASDFDNASMFRFSLYYKEHRTRRCNNTDFHCQLLLWLFCAFRHISRHSCRCKIHSHH